jgi:hypothetical protein
MPSPLPWAAGLMLSAAASLLLHWVPAARAETALDLSGRIVIDGFTSDYTEDETIFQTIPGGGLEESTIDSKWGRYNDVNNVRITWDANYVYVAVEGYIYDNNTMIFFDTLPSPDGQNPGWKDFASMQGGWSRAVSFPETLDVAQGIVLAPDLFLATWDGNTTPQIWQYTGPNQDSQVPEGSFSTVATFSRDLSGRAMEAAIPWDVFFLGKGTRAFDPAYGDTVYHMPEGIHDFKLVAWITTGADGLGGPDSAPDNLSGMQVDSAVPVVLDNFARVTVDSVNAQGQPVPDGVPDFGVQVRRPTTADMTLEEYQQIADEFFFFPPPVRGQALELTDLKVSPRAIAPGLGDQASFSFRLKPEITDERLRKARNLTLTAELYNLNGERVRTIYRDRQFKIEALEGDLPPPQNVIDGRDAEGRILDGGIYVLRVVLEPGQDEISQAMAVVR